MFYRCVSIILVLSLVLAAGAVAAPADSQTVCLFVGKSETYIGDQKGMVDKDNPDVAPFVKDNRTLVPVRFIAESFGAKVDFNEAASAVTVRAGGRVIVFVLGSSAYSVNGEAKVLDVPADTYNDRTFIPLRAMAEAMDKQVFWDDRGLIIISDRVIDKDTDKAFIDTMVGRFTGQTVEPQPEPAEEVDLNPDEVFKNLPAGQQLMTSSEFFSGHLNGGTYGTSNKVAVKGMPFIEAMEFTTNTQPPNVYTMQYQIPLKQPISKGDAVLLKFAVRCTKFTDESGGGQVGVVIELNKDPYTKAFDGVWSANAEWSNVYKAFTAKNDMPANTLNLNFRLGFKPQTIEIADVQLINYKNAVAEKDLPQIALTYKGREADAQWRKDAEARIEQYRKSDINVIVKDASGNVVPDADVHVQMTRNEFTFGSAMATNYLKDSTANGEQFRKNLKELFNTVVPENALKWPSFMKDRQMALDTVDWLTENGFRVRGHCVIWDSESHLAPGLLQIQDKNEIKKQTIDHINDVMGAVKGKIMEWDVVNEPTKNNTIRTTLFDDKIMVDWYNAARAADPNAKLYVNETGLTGSDSPQVQTFIGILDSMVANKAPFDGIGIQGHFNDQPPSMDNVVKQFQMFSKYGKELKVTEYDTTTPDQKLAADFLRDYLTAAYSIPEMTGFMMWGFWDGAHWRSSAPIFYKDWTLKPSGQVWKDLVLKEWKTDASGKSDTSGKYTVRGHLGEYDITASAGGKTKTVKTVVKRGAASTVEIVLE